MTNTDGWTPAPGTLDTDTIAVVEAAAPYEAKRVHWANLMDKLSEADGATLRLLMNGGAGEHP